MACGYRALNKITARGANPSPLPEEALDQASGAKVFSKIDLIEAHHQMRIKEEDCHKTAIRARFGAYEWRVLTFGLTNAPASFARPLSTILHELNGECLVLFLGDALARSASAEERKRHLRQLFELLRRSELHAKKKKCVIGAEQVEFLGHKVSSAGASMQKRLIDGILERPTPKNASDAQSFMGLANFY